MTDRLPSPILVSTSDENSNAFVPSVSALILFARKYSEALVRIEHVRLDEFRPRWLSVELGHSAGQTEPVQHFLLAGIFDCSERGIPPFGVISRSKGFVQGAVALHVRIKPPRLVVKKRVRPTRGR